MSAGIWIAAVLVVGAAYAVGRSFDDTLTPRFNWSIRTWRRLRLIAIAAIIYAGLVSGRPSLQLVAFAGLVFMGLYLALRVRPRERVDDL